MISSLQSRLSSYPATVASPTTSTPTQTSPAAPSTPTLTESRNTALRTLGGASLFEGTPAATSERTGRLLGVPSSSGGLSKSANIDPAAARQGAVEKAIAGRGQPVDFVNSDGKTEQLSITQLPPPFLENTYVVRVGDERFSVQFQGGTDVDREEFLAQVIDFYSETPPELRDSLDTIVVTPDSGPTTATGGSAAASAGDGKITFYEDGQHLDEGIFHHELAHLIGRQQEDKDDGFFGDIGEFFGGEPPPVPNGWDEAAKADDNFVSSYAEADYNKDGNYTEDFADAWRGYMEALDAGPEALAAFREQFPERAEILEDIYPPPESA